MTEEKKILKRNNAFLLYDFFGHAPAQGVMKFTILVDPSLNKCPIRSLSSIYMRASESDTWLAKMFLKGHQTAPSVWLICALK